LNGNQVQQVSEESLNFERAPLKLQRAIKLPPTKTKEREREGRKRGRRWRGCGDDAACEKNRGSLSFLGRSFDGPEKINILALDSSEFVFVGSFISFGHSTWWSGLGNLAILTWRCGIGGLEMRTWQLDLIIEQCGLSHLQSELEKQVK